MVSWAGSSQFWRVGYPPLLNVMSLLSLNDVVLGQFFFKNSDSKTIEIVVENF